MFFFVFNGSRLVQMTRRNIGATLLQAGAARAARGVPQHVRVDLHFEAGSLSGAF
jgi:hypothetical protein